MSAKPVILNLGLGVDSTAILLRVLLEPEYRDFELSDLTVITAMTGDEWERTGRDTEAHILPLLCQFGIRYVQVARNRPNVSTRMVPGTGLEGLDQMGINVLDDSTCPTRLYIEGDYKLSDEMFDNGTVPQLGGTRKCSLKAKGAVLDPTIARLTGGRPFRQIMGFEVEEKGRAERDARDGNSATRTGEYPLITWGWDRKTCLAYIKAKTGVDWEKSACKYCPFAMSSIPARAKVMARYATEEPEAVVLALLMEHNAIALNPRQGLMGERRLVEELARAGYTEEVARFRARLAAQQTWALYEVRRIVKTFSNPDRSIRTLAQGTEAEMEDALLDKAIETGTEPYTGRDGISRAWVLRSGDDLPRIDHFFVVAPAIPKDKQRPRFEARWRETMTRLARRQARLAREATTAA
jgi:hypothetical protein